MKREHRYRVTHVGRFDFGGSQACDVTAYLAIVPDGSEWARQQPKMTLRIDEGELAPGDVVRLTIEAEG